MAQLMRNNKIRVVITTAMIICIISTLFQISFLQHYTNNMIGYIDISPKRNITAKTSATNIDYFYHITTPQPLPTLVHFDPYFMGGYRNQHMRFVGFVNFAVKNNITQILLPSLRWGTSQGKDHGKSAPHEYLFDVVYWNEHAIEMGLPRLVRYDPNILEGLESNNNNNNTIVACFNVSSNLYSELDEQLLRDPNTNLRKVDIIGGIGKSEEYSHCKRPVEGKYYKPDAGQHTTEKQDRYTHLIAVGGSKQSGVLWNEYNGMQKSRGGTQLETIDNQTFHIYAEHSHVEQAIMSLMHPSEPIRVAINTFINSVAYSTKHQTNRLLALHPRLEYDMIFHRCSQFMERNLTNVFEYLRRFTPFDVLFVAINNEMFDVDSLKSIDSYRDLLIGNHQVLNHTRHFGLYGDVDNYGIPMLEAGMDTAANILFPDKIPSDSDGLKYTPTLVSAESLGLTSLVGSVLNFFILTEAETFVGVKGSSYSTDVFNTRYYLHKGDSYIINKDGIEKLHGPAPPHSCDH